jgi:phosphatidylglycerol:prolipoprotein diacylglycerol transferase
VHPRLFHIGDYWQPTYGVMAALGLLAAFFLIDHLAKRQHLNADRMWNLAGLAILSGLGGAKLLLVVNEWGYYGQHLREIFTTDTLLRAGGVFSGGFVLAVCVSWLYLRHARIPFLRGADVMAPAIALGHAFGRLGCFSAGCCYGRPTNLPWGVTFTDPVAHAQVGTPLGIRLHPTQLYEFSAEAINFALLYWLIGRKKFEGQVIGLYLFLYGCERFVIEFFRGDTGRGTVFGGALTTTQLISLGLVLAGSVLWFLRRPLIAPAEGEEKHSS